MSENFVRVYRHPLIANVFSPLRWDLPDDINLPDAKKTALELGKLHGYEKLVIHLSGKYFLLTRLECDKTNIQEW